MINEKYKFIYIHIPRTGGTSIEKQFGYAGDTQDQDPHGDGRKHWSLSMWEKEDIDLSDYFVFTFIRNPWEVILSKYFDHYYTEEYGCPIGFRSGKSLEYFLENYKIPEHEYGDCFLDYFDPRKVDFIGRYENRESDLNYVSKKIGKYIDPKRKIRESILKKRKKIDYREYYNDTTREMVQKRYFQDIIYFNFKF